jgi:2-dehydropantoate 2-reductase
MRILIYGAGAIGSDLGALLTASGEDVTLLARGAQLAALKSAGVTIERKGKPPQQVPVQAASAEACRGPYDVIFVTLKSTQLEDAAADIVSRLRPDGAMVMIQNGLPWWYFEGIDSPFAGSPLPCLDPSGRLRAQIPLARVVGAVIYRPVTQLAPGKIFLPEIMPPRLWIGEVDNRISERLRAIADLVSRAGLPTEPTPDIRQAKWQKLMMNLIWNPLCAITQSSPGHIVASPLAADMVRLMLGEGSAVARSVGVSVKADPDAELERIRENFTQQPSMLQDVRAGRSIESDAIVNAVVDMARLTGVPVPTLKSVAAWLDVLNQAVIRQGQGIGFLPKP